MTRTREIHIPLTESYDPGDYLLVRHRDNKIMAVSGNSDFGVTYLTPQCYLARVIRNLPPVFRDVECLLVDVIEEHA